LVVVNLNSDMSFQFECIGRGRSAWCRKAQLSREVLLARDNLVGQLSVEDRVLAFLRDLMLEQSHDLVAPYHYGFDLFFG